MWVFYVISLPITMGMVAITLWYFAGPDVPRYVHVTVGYAWFSSICFITLVPADIWTTIIDQHKGGISFFWSWSYWSTFLLTWAVVPTLQGYEDAGDFTVTERLKTSARRNLVYYACIGTLALFGVILLVILEKSWRGNILGFAMACSNTFGLVTGAFLLGFGLSEIPKGIWRNADWTNRQKVLSHKVAKMALKLDDAHQNFSNVIVIAQVTSKQMSKRDPLRPYMNVIDKMLDQMLGKDPSFKPQGGRLGESDMDYDTDEKTMATLRRQLKVAQEKYYRYKSEYTNFVTEALELEDTIRNYQHCSSNGWKYVSSFRPQRSGRLGTFLDITELVWRCFLRKQLEKFSAIALGCMSAAILLAEATMLPSGVDLSLFSLLINAVKRNEVLVQVSVLIPLMYMCVCTYYSLFKIGMLMFYSLTPGQTSSVSLLMICSMVSRYAPPISYNFLNLIHLDGKQTTFEKRMGTMDDAVPFFGEGFNKIYPLIMVVYTIAIASNCFDRVVQYFGNWSIFSFQSETADDLDGFDPSGLIILQRERAWLEQGHKVGELVIPLARNFNNTNVDVEYGNTYPAPHKAKSSTSLAEDEKNSLSKPLRQEATSRENIGRKYAAMRTQQETEANSKKKTTFSTSSSSSLNDTDNLSDVRAEPSSRIASTWQSMKVGFRNLKSNIEARKFIPLRQGEGSEHSRVSSSESLDDIFQRIKRPALGNTVNDSDDDVFDDFATGTTRPGTTNR